VDSDKIQGSLSNVKSFSRGAPLLRMKEGRKEGRRDRHTIFSLTFSRGFFNQSVTSVVAIKFKYVDAEDHRLILSCSEGAPHLDD
jgi:hypothetical protein